MPSTCKLYSKRLPRRFWAKVVSYRPSDYSPIRSNCWHWTGAQSQSRSGRYASFWANGKTVRAHIWVLQELGVRIKPGHQVDHKCRNTLCVNPAHLEPVTGKKNRDRYQALVKQIKRLAQMAKLMD